MAVRPGLLPQVLEHGGRGGIADGPGIVAGEQRLDRDARHGREGRTISRPGRRQAVGRWRPGPWPAARGAGLRNFSTRGRRSADAGPGRLRSSARTRLASPVSSVVHSPSGPVPAIGSRPGCPVSGRPRPSARRRGRPRSVPRVGYRPRRPARHRRAARPGSLRAWRPRPPAGRDPGRAWSGTRPGRCWPAALALQVLEPLGPLGLVEVLRAWFPPAFEPFELGDQFAEPRLLGRARAAGPGGRPARRAGRGPGLPRAPATPRPADRAGPARRPAAAREFVCPGAFQAGEGDPEPGRIQALHRTQPLVARLEVSSPGR